MNRVMTVMVVILLILSASGCGSLYESPQPSNEETIGTQVINQPAPEVYYTIGMHIIVPYWQDHRLGLVAAGEELGVEVVFTGENGSNALRQVDIFRQVIEKNPAGILLCPIDEELMIEPINDAMAKGIPVVCIDADAPGSDRLTYFGTDNYGSGYLAAEIIGEAINGKGDVAILTIPGISSLEERVRGFEEGLLDKYPDVKVVAIRDDQADPYRAANVAGQLFDEFPTLVGLFGADAASGVGAAIALDEKDKMNQIKVVAFDKDSSVLDLVEQGKIEATLVQRTFTMSYYGLKFLYDYNHNRVEMFENDSNISPLPDSVDTGIVVVTKENVESFK